ncbi:hypothetical protein K523DRAFT_256649 [Schizophyllum commune Tattone D]|nr:hypothetical protein K523DRAFT_256649 [Schizophyllum commune Tattone D]
MAEQRRQRFLVLHHLFHGHMTAQRARGKLNLPRETTGTSLRRNAVARRESATMIIFLPEYTP